MQTQARSECAGEKSKQVVCTKYVNGNPCSGDSGGPLAQNKDTDGRWVLYGVLSYGSVQCNLDDKTAFNGYADVSNYYQTIIRQVRANP